MTVPGGGTAAGGGGGARLGSSLGAVLFAAVLLAGAALEEAEAETIVLSMIRPAALECEPFVALLLMESEPGAQQ